MKLRRRAQRRTKDRLGRLEARSATHRRGIVTDTDPYMVAVGGASTSIEVPGPAGAFDVDDVVTVAMWRGSCEIVSGGSGGGSASAGDLDGPGLEVVGSELGVDTGTGVGIVGDEVAITDAELLAMLAVTSAADKLFYFTGPGTGAVADFSAFARTLLDDADAATARATLGLVIGTNVQAFDADLAAIAALTTAAYGRSVLEVANAAALRTLAGLVIGTDVQAQDAELAALAGLTSAADRLPYFTGSGTAALATFSAFARTLLDDADAAAVLTTLGVSAFVQTLLDDANQGTARTTLGVGTGDSPQFTAVNVGDAADTTLARSGAGELTVEGKRIFRVDGADVPVADGGTGASDASGARTNLGLVIGTNVQAQDAELAALAGLTSAADKIPYFTGSGTAALADFTSTARSLLDDTSFSAMRTTLGVAYGSSAGTVVEGNDARVPTQSENDALAGTDGSPSNTNRYVTDSDPLRRPTELALNDAALSLGLELYATLGSGGSGLTDLTGNSNDGTGAGSITIGAGASLNSESEGSTVFDGNDDRVSFPVALAGDMTLFGWADTDASILEVAELFRGSGATEPYLTTEYVGTGRTLITYVGQDGSGFSFQWDVAGVDAASKFFWMLALDQAANTAELFINGVSQGVQVGVTDLHANAGDLTIGAASNSWHGEQSHIGVATRVLTVETAAWLWRIGAGQHKDWGLVNTLPTGALVGDTCQYVASVTNGVIWHLVNDGQGSHPWKYIGGPPLVASDVDGRALTNQTTYANLPTDPMSLTIPLAGDWDIEAQVNCAPAAAASAFGQYSYAVGATAASDDWAAFNRGVLANVLGQSVVKTHRHTGVAAAASVAEKARTGGNYAVTWSARRLLVTPVRVG